MPNIIANSVSQYDYKREVTSTEGKGGVTQSAQTLEKAQSVKEQQVIDKTELVSRVENLNQLVKRNLEFSVDSNTGQQVLRVIDSETGDVVRQIPSDQILHVISQVQKAKEGMLQGVLLDDKV
jgi:flagellar protein FlaG